jgi:DNA-binding transcriptional MerR regulator
MQDASENGAVVEREGLLRPSRSEGNTRLYTDEDLERLELILKLTRDLGVNLAGVEIILNVREKMEAMQRTKLQWVAIIHRNTNPRTSTSPCAASTKTAWRSDSRVTSSRVVFASTRRKQQLSNSAPHRTGRRRSPAPERTSVSFHFTGPWHPQSRSVELGRGSIYG